MNDIKAIPTKYNGVQFRSRLEARWAVFFDQTGTDWRFEHEGYELNPGQPWSRWYVPDFIVRCTGKWENIGKPEIETWIEVKPESLSHSELHNVLFTLRDLVFLTKKKAILAIGPPSNAILWTVGYYHECYNHGRPVESEPYVEMSPDIGPAEFDWLKPAAQFADKFRFW